jgi:hypothetical protein
LYAAAVEEPVGGDEEGIGALERKTGKGRIDLADRRGVEDMDLQPDGRGGFPYSRNVVSALEALLGLMSTAKRTALGTKSCKSRSRLAATSREKELKPVALPPGRARLATRPSRTGSSGTPKTIGIVAVAALAASEATMLPGVAITATNSPPPGPPLSESNAILQRR